MVKRLKLFGMKRFAAYFCRPKTGCRVRLRARTPPFHGGDTGSNPVRGTRKPHTLWGFPLKPASGKGFQFFTFLPVFIFAYLFMVLRFLRK